MHAQIQTLHVGVSFVPSGTYVLLDVCIHVATVYGMGTNCSIHCMAKIDAPFVISHQL